MYFFIYSTSSIASGSSATNKHRHEALVSDELPGTTDDTIMTPGASIVYLKELMTRNLYNNIIYILRVTEFEYYFLWDVCRGAQPLVSSRLSVSMIL